MTVFRTWPFPSSLFLMGASVRRTLVVSLGSRRLTAERSRLRLCWMSAVRACTGSSLGCSCFLACFVVEADSSFLSAEELSPMATSFDMLDISNGVVCNEGLGALEVGHSLVTRPDPGRSGPSRQSASVRTLRTRPTWTFRRSERADAA